MILILHANEGFAWQKESKRLGAPLETLAEYIPFQTKDIQKYLRTQGTATIDAINNWLDALYGQAALQDAIDLPQIPFLPMDTAYHFYIARPEKLGLTIEGKDIVLAFAEIETLFPQILSTQSHFILSRPSGAPKNIKQNTTLETVRLAFLQKDELTGFYLIDRQEDPAKEKFFALFNPSL